MQNIEALKLITGEIVVAKVIDSTPSARDNLAEHHYLTLHKPQTLYVQQDKQGNQVVGFADFVPFLKSDTVKILLTTIQCHGEADDQITQGYIRATTGVELPPTSGGLILPT